MAVGANAPCRSWFCCQAAQAGRAPLEALQLAHALRQGRVGAPRRARAQLRRECAPFQLALLLLRAQALPLRVRCRCSVRNMVLADNSEVSQVLLCVPWLPLRARCRRWARSRSEC